MQFKSWLLINESFVLPSSVMQPMLDFVVKSAKTHALNPRKKIEGKQFELDLRNTNYKFLYNKNPDIKYVVHVDCINDRKENIGLAEFRVYEMNRLSKIPGNIYFSNVHYESKFGETYYLNRIFINSYNYDNNIIETLEHELLHTVQHFIKYYNDQNTKHLNRKYLNTNTSNLSRKKELINSVINLGGLPPKRILRSVAKKYGIDKDGYFFNPDDIDKRKSDERIDHHKRPVEYYTNLSDVTKRLTRNYIDNIIMTNNNLTKKPLNDPNINFSVEFNKPEFIEAMTDKNKKKEYLLNFIKPDWYMQKIKSTDESVYNLYLKELYKRFVLYDGIASEYLPIYITRHEIKFHKQNETKRKQASGRGRKKIETVETSAGELSVDKFKGYCEINLWDILDYVPPNSGIEEGEQDEFMRELFGEIFKFDDEREIYKINLTYNTMKKVFNTLKKRRQSNPCAYDGIAKNLANLFSYETGRMISQDIILELFYPPPYEC